MDASPQRVTDLLVQVSEGQRGALARLMPLVYGELRSRAAAFMARERPDHTLEPTALVHEVYLQMVDQDRVSVNDRSHFYAIAARLMRQILVQHARARNAAKRQGGRRRISLGEDLLERQGRSACDPLEIEEALQKLRAYDPRLARIVEMRFFAGLTVEEVAAVLKLHPRTVKDEWRVARTLLFKALEDGTEGTAPEA
jgi:RNA polymerase sigma-70 factor (ECF subfamily)